MYNHWSPNQNEIMTNSMNSPHDPYKVRSTESNPYGAPQTGSHQWQDSRTSAGSAHDPSALIRTIWSTRPVRLPSEQNSDAWVFGVAEGIGVRYNIDANLVRLFFAILAITGGGGFLLYGLCILLMPKYSVPLSPLEAVLNNTKDPRYSEEKDWAYALIVIIAITTFGAGWLTDGWGLVGLSVGALLLWLLHQRQPEVPPALHWHPYPSSPVDGNKDAPKASESNLPMGEAQSDQADPVFTPVEGFEPKRQTPPSWDPLGAAPFAWDLPDPDQVLGAQTVDSSSTATGTTKKKRSGLRKFVMGVLGVALGIALVMSAFVAAGLVFGEPDSSSSTIGSTGAVYLVDSEAGKTDISISSTTVLLDDLTINSDSKHDINTYSSAVTIELPSQTTGPSYRIRTECEAIFGAVSNCADARDHVVKGNDWTPELASDTGRLPMLRLHIKSVFSSVDVQTGK